MKPDLIDWTEIEKAVKRCWDVADRVELRGIKEGIVVQVNVMGVAGQVVQQNGVENVRWTIFQQLVGKLVPGVVQDIRHHPAVEKEPWQGLGPDTE